MNNVNIVKTTKEDLYNIQQSEHSLELDDNIEFGEYTYSIFINNKLQAIVLFYNTIINTVEVAIIRDINITKKELIKTLLYMLKNSYVYVPLFTKRIECHVHVKQSETIKLCNMLGFDIIGIRHSLYGKDYVLFEYLIQKEYKHGS